MLEHTGRLVHLSISTRARANYLYFVPLFCKARASTRCLEKFSVIRHRGYLLPEVNSELADLDAFRPYVTMFILKKFCPGDTVIHWRYRFHLKAPTIRQDREVRCIHRRPGDRGGNGTCTLSQRNWLSVLKRASGLAVFEPAQAVRRCIAGNSKTLTGKRMETKKRANKCRVCWNSRKKD